MVSVSSLAQMMVEEKYDHGTIPYELYRIRDKIGAQAETEIGHQVPDTAMGYDEVNAWLTKHLQEKLN